MEYIAEKIKSVLKEKSISQQEMADHVGMTLDGFRKMLIKNTYKLDVILQIAEKLGKPLDYFLDDNKTVETLSEPQTKYVGHQNQVIENCEDAIKRQDKIIESQSKMIETLNESVRQTKDIIASQSNMIDKLATLLGNYYSGKEPEDNSNFQNPKTAESA